MNKLDTVRIEKRLVSRIGVREWGLPTLVMPGKIWRSREKGLISCMLASGDTRIRTETRTLEVINIGEYSRMPDTWRDALWEYVQAQPYSGCGFGPFLRITEKQRCDFIRKMAIELSNSDDIGCRSMAESVGALAAWGYEIPSDLISSTLVGGD